MENNWFFSHRPWERILQATKIKQIDVKNGVLYNLQENGEIWKATGIPNRPWERIAENFNVVQIEIDQDGTLYIHLKEEMAISGKPLACLIDLGSEF